MPNSSQDQERFKRLRDRQLADRDPHTKQRKLHSGIAQRHRRTKESFSLRRMWLEIPHMWRNTVYGLVLGILILLIVPSIWASPWAMPCSAGSIPILAILGFFIGRAFDAKKTIQDLMR